MLISTLLSLSPLLSSTSSKRLGTWILVSGAKVPTKISCSQAFLSCWRKMRNRVWKWEGQVPDSKWGKRRSSRASWCPQGPSQERSSSYTNLCWIELERERKELNCCAMKWVKEGSRSSPALQGKEVKIGHFAGIHIMYVLHEGIFIFACLDSGTHFLHFKTCCTFL